jgi:uncharacterized OB-fold protein
MTQRPLPQPTRITQPYWDAARENRLMIQQCGNCHQHQFYPRQFCVSCLSEDIKWVASSGRGKVYTYTINRRSANPAMSELVPYVVAAVDLEEGVRMIANIVDTPVDQVKIGSPVEVRFEKLSDEITLPQFTIAG